MSNEAVPPVSPEAEQTPTPPTTSDQPPKADPENTLLGKQPAAEAAPSLDVKDIALPDGFEADEGMMTEFVGLLNKQDLSPKERANGLIELQARFATAAAEKAQADRVAAQESLQAEVRNDPEVGGAKLQPILGNIGKMLESYPHANEIRELMDSTGMGNHLGAIKFMNWVANQLNEGRPATATLPAPTGTKTVEEILYPTMKK